MVSDTFLPRINLTLTEHEFWLGRQYKVHTKREISIATFTFYHLQTVFWLTADVTQASQIVYFRFWCQFHDNQVKTNKRRTILITQCFTWNRLLIQPHLPPPSFSMPHRLIIHAQLHIKKVFSIFISDSPFFPGRYFLCDRLCDLACPQGFLAPPPPLPHLRRLLSLLRPTWTSHPPPSRGQSKATPVGPWTHLQAESSRQPWKHSWPCFRLALQSLWPELWINQWTGSTLLREKAKLYMQPLWNAYSLQQCIKWPCLWEPCW